MLLSDDFPFGILISLHIIALMCLKIHLPVKRVSITYFSGLYLHLYFSVLLKNTFQPQGNETGNQNFNESNLPGRARTGGLVPTNTFRPKVSIMLC